MSLESDNKADEKSVMRVKGKALNTFIGILRADLLQLKIEAFPEHINNKLNVLMLLPKADLIWFDLQIEQRVATLRVNVFVGENLGNSTYRVGFVCLIGIAHLPEKMEALTYSDSIELRPTIITDIGPEVTRNLLDPQLVP